MNAARHIARIHEATVIQALLAERKFREYGQDRFNTATRRTAWRIIRTSHQAEPVDPSDDYYA